VEHWRIPKPADGYEHRKEGELSRTALILAFLTVIPVGHHSTQILPSYPFPLTPVALLIYGCPIPFI